jgi:hypothetical protein
VHGLKKRRKNIWAHEGPSIENFFGHMKVQEGNKYICIAMPLCFPNKGERDS